MPGVIFKCLGLGVYGLSAEGLSGLGCRDLGVSLGSLVCNNDQKLWFKLPGIIRVCIIPVLSRPLDYAFL